MQIFLLICILKYFCDVWMRVYKKNEDKKYYENDIIDNDTA